MDTNLCEARQRVENIRAHLPSSISVAALGVRSKAPYLLLCTREALIWRTEELARCACDVLAKDDVAAGILLTRAVIESATRRAILPNDPARLPSEYGRHTGRCGAARL